MDAREARKRAAEHAGRARAEMAEARKVLEAADLPQAPQAEVIEQGLDTFARELADEGGS